MTKVIKAEMERISGQPTIDFILDNGVSLPFCPLVHGTDTQQVVNYLIRFAKVLENQGGEGDQTE